MKTYVFPGQGSQIKGMGANLFNEFPELVEKANKILGYSIEELCLKDPDNKLNLTQYTQPALYVVNALTYYKKISGQDKKPDYLAGHSLGEYNAILAAGGFNFETGLRIVEKRGELMSKSFGGTMAAVVGLTEVKIKELLRKSGITGIDIANFNTPTQVVISGYKEDIESSKAIFEQEGASHIELNVSAAFHSRYMQGAKDEFEKFLTNFQFSKLNIPVISNVTGEPYNSEEIASNLANQLRSSVRWTDSIHYLISQGEMVFEELGPGTVLTNLISKIKKEIEPIKEETTDEEKLATLKENKLHGVTEYKRKLEIIYQKINDWNNEYPIGTKVVCKGYEKELKTRTEALLLFGHRAAIYVENYNGYFALDEITPV